MQNMNAALSDPDCCIPNIYTHHCDFTWTSCSFSAKTCREKIAVEHKDAAPFISMWSASSAKSSADTCGKKSQFEALAKGWATRCESAETSGKNRTMYTVKKKTVICCGIVQKNLRKKLQHVALSITLLFKVPSLIRNCRNISTNYLFNF